MKAAAPETTTIASILRVGVDSITVPRTGWVADKVIAWDGLSCQVRVSTKDAGIDHSDDHFGHTGGHVPGGGQVNQRVVPLGWVGCVVGYGQRMHPVVGLGKDHGRVSAQGFNADQCFPARLQVAIDQVGFFAPGQTEAIVVLVAEGYAFHCQELLPILSAGSVSYAETMDEIFFG